MHSPKTKCVVFAVLLLHLVVIATNIVNKRSKSVPRSLHGGVKRGSQALTHRRPTLRTLPSMKFLYALCAVPLCHLALHEVVYGRQENVTFHFVPSLC